jgi:TonB family protein
MAGIGGEIRLRLDVDAEGRVVTARVVEGSGRQELDSAAVNVARIAKFVPRRLDVKSPTLCSSQVRHHGDPDG